MTEKVRIEAGGDRLIVESTGAIIIKSGGILRVEPGSIVEIAEAIKSFSGTSFALSPTDTGKTLMPTSGSAVSIAVPAGLMLNPAGTAIETALPFVEGAGVTIRTAETLTLAKQYAAATLYPTETAD